MGVPGSPGQETFLSGLQLCLTEEMAVTFLSPCVRATNPTQTRAKMCHHLSCPRTHRDVLAQGPELCLRQRCRGCSSHGPPELQTGHGPLGPRAQGAGSMAPAPAGLLRPALAPVVAKLLVFTREGRGDRSPQTDPTCLAAPPVRMCVLQQQASEAAARVGCPQP